jgi:ABC-type cobalamin/Fe3+-siderophores transport system ATPase subunit
LKVRRVTIRNFRPFDAEGVTVEFRDVVALVGLNNSGKSSILYALDLFFDPSVTKVREDSFHAGNLEDPIEIRVEFDRLTDADKEYFRGYTVGDSLTAIRRFRYGQEDTVERKLLVEHVGVLKQPQQEWLRESSVSAEAIKTWLADSGKLSLNGANFLDFLPGKKPTVAQWKEAIPRFLEVHGNRVEWAEEENPNIKGYANVLKGGLPEFILVPAVREASDETKIQKTNPFGKVINWVLRRISQQARQEIDGYLQRVRRLLNRTPEGGRLAQIEEIERTVNRILNEQMTCQLELEVAAPGLEDIFSGGTRIYVDDGFRTSLDLKGHGLQRSVIFAILRTYMEMQKLIRQDENRPPRPCVFGIEEPEIYLHPQVQRATLDLLRQIARGGDQVVYSTHSPFLVDVACFDEVCLVRREQQNGRLRSKVTQLLVERLIADLKARWAGATPTPESIRERYSHVYDAARNEGFFAKKVIIGEGDTEQYALPIYAAAVGVDLDKENISVIDAGGKGNIDRLFRIYNEFGIPCYLIFDYDEAKHDQEPELKRQAEELLRLLGDSPEEALRQPVADRYCMFRQDFETALKVEVPDYDQLDQEAAQELGLRKDTGKPLRARFIAKRLAARGVNEGDPSKYVPPTIRAIVEAVKGLEWNGSILVS